VRWEDALLLRLLDRHRHLPCHATTTHHTTAKRRGGACSCSRGYARICSTLCWAALRVCLPD
jgi:hypothetical protein